MADKSIICASYEAKCVLFQALLRMSSRRTSLLGLLQFVHVFVVDHGNRAI